MTAVQRFDHGTLSAAVSVAGGLRVPATVARTGVQVYAGPDGKMVREYRPDSEVFAEEALATLRGAPITIGHRARVTPANWSAVAVGFVAGDPRRDGEWVAVDVQAATQETIDRIAARELVEVSCGYDTVIVDQPGRTDSGEEYDRVQTQIRYNHVALGPTGFARAGRNARLRLDGNEDPTEESKPMIFKIDGADFDLSKPEGAAAAAARVETLTSAAKDAAAKADAATARADAATARADAAEARLAAREADGARAAVVEQVKARCPDLKCDGLSVRQIQVAAVKLAKQIDIPEDKSDGYVAAYFDATFAAPAEVYQGAARSDAADPYKSHLARLESFKGSR